MSTTQLHNGDCLEIMKSIPDFSVDMVLCDLPYGTTKCSWDVVIPFEELWCHYNRIAKPNAAILLFGQEPFSSYLRLSNISDYRYDLVWEKESFTNFMQVKRRFGKSTECISVFYKNQPTYNPQMYKHIGKPVTNKYSERSKRFRSKVCADSNGSLQLREYHDNGLRYPSNVLRFNRVKKSEVVHPTQKPVELCEYLIRTFTNDGDVVLDNCMGSGSTGIACVRTGRGFIGIEKDEKYFQIASDRINNAKILKFV